MTQEDKELLLKDLCARLPYGVKLDTLEGSQELDTRWLTINMCNISSPYLPYLFPLSSISEEQKKYISDRWGVNEDFDFEIDPNWGECFIELSDAVNFINWCYENHFDINFLIPKGSALDATGLNIY